MFKKLLAACAAITLIAQVVVSYLSIVSQNAFADSVHHSQVFIPPVQFESVVVEALPVLEENPYTNEDLQCMTENIYFEARNQSLDGQYAVGEVVLNRLADPDFPKTVCGVVKQKTKINCQFSWYCDGQSDRMVDRDAEARARLIARTILLYKTNFTEGAKYYHANYVKPGWRKSGKIKQIQDHIFYSRI